VGLGILKPGKQSGRQWVTPIILATQKAEIGRIKVLRQPSK
jgi:hypothetical protein